MVACVFVAQTVVHAQCDPTLLCPQYPCTITGIRDLGEYCTLDFIDSATGRFGDVTLAPGAKLTVTGESSLEIRARSVDLQGDIAAAGACVDFDLTGQFSTAASSEIRANGGSLCVTAPGLQLSGQTLILNPDPSGDYAGDIDLCAGVRESGRTCAMGAGSCRGGGVLTLSQDIVAKDGDVALSGTEVYVAGNVSVDSVEDGLGTIEVAAIEGNAAVTGLLSARGSGGNDGGEVTIRSARDSVGVTGVVDVSASADGVAGAIVVEAMGDVTVDAAATLVADGTSTNADAGIINLIAGRDNTIDVAGTVRAVKAAPGELTSNGKVLLGRFLDVTVPVPSPDPDGQPCHVAVSGTLDTRRTSFDFVEGGVTQIGYRDSLTFSPSASMEADVTITTAPLNRIFCRKTGGACASPPAFNGASIMPVADVLSMTMAPCAECGDGVLGGEETCDDGNATNGDGCDANCTPTGCGNGIATGAEMCDDGNARNGDGCDVNCTPTACGNGELSPNTGERCDDGNVTSGDGCSTSCDLETVFRVDSGAAGVQSYQPSVSVRSGSGEMLFAWTDASLCPENGDARGVRLRSFAGGLVGERMPIVDAQVPCVNGAKYRPVVSDSRRGFPVAFVGANPGSGPGGDGVWVMNWGFEPRAVQVRSGIPSGWVHMAPLESSFAPQRDVVGLAFYNMGMPIEFMYVDLDLDSPVEDPVLAWYLGTLRQLNGDPAFPTEEGFAFNLHVWLNQGVWMHAPFPFAITDPPQRVDVGGTPIGRVAVALPTPSMNPDGAVIVWRDDRSGSSVIMARILESYGQFGQSVFATGELTISEGNGVFYNPTLAVQPDGSFMVSWVGAACGAHKVLTRAFSPLGAPVAPPAQIDSVVAGSRPQIAALPTGDYVVAWEKPGAAGGGQIMAAVLTP